MLKQLIFYSYSYIVLTPFTSLFSVGITFAGCNDNPIGSGNWYPDLNSPSDVTSCLNNDSFGDGDTIHLQSSGIWSSGVTITRPCTISGGARMTYSPSTYVDTSSWPVTITANSSMIFRIQGSPGDFIRITGIRFTGNTPSGYGNGAIQVGRGNYSNKWRVDNCKFDVRGQAGGIDANYGLFDHCYFTGDNRSNVRVRGFYGDTTGNGAWARPTAQGTDDYLYFEDCVWYDSSESTSPTTAFIDAQGGGKYVIRYSVGRNAYFSVHGAATGNPERSGRAIEVYENASIGRILLIVFLPSFLFVVAMSFLLTTRLKIFKGHTRSTSIARVVPTVNLDPVMEDRLGMEILAVLIPLDIPV